MKVDSNHVRVHEPEMVSPVSKKWNCREFVEAHGSWCPKYWWSHRVKTTLFQICCYHDFQTWTLLHSKCATPHDAIDVLTSSIGGTTKLGRTNDYPHSVRGGPLYWLKGILRYHYNFSNSQNMRIGCWWELKNLIRWGSYPANQDRVVTNCETYWHDIRMDDNPKAHNFLWSMQT